MLQLFPELEFGADFNLPLACEKFTDYFDAEDRAVKVTDDILPILESLEYSVVEVWRVYPEMTDYAALTAYEAAYHLYRDEKRGHVPKLPQLRDLDAVVFESVKIMCEIQLGRDPTPTQGLTSLPPLPVVPLETLLDCLHELIKSVKRHTETDGRQGYLTFIDEFLPYD